jgi:hypothetical protein
MGIVISGPWLEPPHPTLSKSALSRETGRSVRTIERDVKAGAPHSRNGVGLVRFHLSSYLSWLDQRTGGEAA